jgi:hypothetical protein
VAPDHTIADIDKYKTKLFDLYTRFRYNELICDKLMLRASRIEGLVRWSVLITVLISLVTGALDKLNPAVLAPLWAVFGAIATFLAIYSLVVTAAGSASSGSATPRACTPLRKKSSFSRSTLKWGKFRRTNYWTGGKHSVGDWQMLFSTAE